MLSAERDGVVIVAPMRVESSEKDKSGRPVATGVTWVRLQPGDPGYDIWDRHLRELEQTRRRPSWSSRVAAGLDGRARRG